MTRKLTFLLTDIEGSTDRWERQPDAMREALARHDELLRETVTRWGGRVFKSAGDGLWAVFDDAIGAVAASVAAVRAVETTDWGVVAPLRIRAGLHGATIAEVEERDDDFFGAPLNRCARLVEVAHGGQILVTGVVAEAVGPAGDTWSLRGLGEHRLRDLREAEQVHQVVHPELPADFPPIASLDVYPHNLPVRRTSFVGRGSELAELTRLVREERLVMLTGVGGAGKTRLALGVAAEVVDAFPDGTWMVDLTAVHDEALVPQAVATTLGLREQRGRQLGDVLVDHVRDRRLLLLLDNCEHVVAACARLVDHLLRRSHHLHLLATSRERLGVAGEHVRQVGPLRAPEPETTDDPGSFDAVRLFMDRATAVAPGLAISHEGLRSVARICRRLDGIPLALELAAARLAVLSPAEIEERLDDRFRLLTGGSRTAVAQHQTLRAAVDWSHELLDEAERTLFRRLAVFAGPVTLDGIEEVVSDELLPRAAVLDTLSALVEKSLVTAGRSEGRTRYRMLQTVREYARERLVAAEEAVPLAREHAGWVMRCAEELRSQIRMQGFVTSAGLAASEHDLRAALDHLERTDPQAALRLAAETSVVWWTEGRLAEGRDRLERTLESLDDEVPPGLRARALAGLAMLATSQGDLSVAERYAGEVTEAGGPYGTNVTCLWVRGVVAWARGDLDAAVDWHDRGTALARGIGYRYGEEIHLIALARVHRTRGDLDRAEELLHEAHASYGEADEAPGSAPILDGLARVAYLRGQPDRAAELAERSRRRFDRAGYLEGIASTLTVGAAAALAQGRPDRAGDELGRALEIFQRMGHGGGLASTLEVAAALVLAEGAPGDAARLLGAVESIRQRLGERPEGDEPLVGQRLRADLRAELGDGFDDLRGRGARLTVDDAVAIALRGSHAPPGTDLREGTGRPRSLPSR